MDYAWGIAALALVFGAGLGLRGLVDPHWAATLLRLREVDDRSGGFAEFRATFGGLFLFAHLTALAAVARYIYRPDDVIGVYAGGALAVLSAAWGGAAVGRIVSMLRDGANTGFNRVSVLVELAIAAMLAAPWFVGVALPFSL